MHPLLDKVVAQSHGILTFGGVGSRVIVARVAKPSDGIALLFVGPQVHRSPQKIVSDRTCGNIAFVISVTNLARTLSSSDGINPEKLADVNWRIKRDGIALVLLP